MTSATINDSQVTSDEGIPLKANEDGSVSQISGELPEDNLGFVSEIPDDTITVEKFHAEGVYNTNAK